MKMGGRRPSAATWTVMILIGLGVLLSLGLGWQAVRAWQTKERVLQAAMHDYALLAGNRFAQNGVYTLYRKLSVLSASAPDIGGQDQMQPAKVLAEGLNQPDSAWSELRPMVRRVFFTHQNGRLTRWAEPDASDEQFIATIESALGPLRDIKRPGLFVGDGQDEIYYGFPLPGGNGLAGVELIPEKVFEQLWSAASTNLLPGLLDGPSDQDAFAIEILGPSNRVLKSTPASPDPETAAEVPYANLYDGLLPGYVVRLSLSPLAAQQLLSSRPDPGRAWRLMFFVAALLLVLALSVLLVRRQQQLAALRERFVAQVSHELRTPLTQIRMYAESLRLNRLDAQQDREHALKVIDREAQRLGNLVENVLSFSRLQQNTGLLQPRDLDLVAEVNRHAHQFATLHNGLPVEIRVEENGPVMAHVDPDSLQQVVFNLLDNAVKYGGRDVQVNIEVRGSPQPILIVEDDGPGIPPGERKKIWREFYRPDREQRKATSGSGIGLALVLGLMHASGGDISLLDSDRGARFELRFQPAVSA